MIKELDRKKEALEGSSKRTIYMQRKEDERRRQEKRNESKGKPKESRNGKNRQAVIPQREIEIKEKIDLCLRWRNFLDSVLI